MTSPSIYDKIEPTYLYIKQHSITKKKYFGKTTQDPYKYLGSGKYWLSHIKKHGKEHIVTIWVSEPFYDTSITEVALHLSKENNIVNSNDWANLILENGLDGAPKGINRNINSGSFKKGSIPWCAGKKLPTVSIAKKLFWMEWHETNIKKEKIYTKIGVSKDIRNMYSENITNMNTLKLTCPHCKVIGIGYATMHKWHFDRCKSNTEYTPNLFQCPYCDKSSINKANMTRYHFDNCKFKV